MDRFERIDKLGEGGQGKVYKVRKKDTGEVVVLKMINCSDPQFATLAEREIEVMKACVHPHIIRFEESFQHTGKSGSWVCLVMQYCAGGDLFTKFKNAVQEKKKFDEATLVSWICQIASGLHYMHEKDLWHRDVKAANVLFDEKGVVKLGDFGLSSSYSPDGHKTVVGTPFYFAPEIMLNKQYSNKVDIWNLGVVMLELMTFKQRPVNVEVLQDDQQPKKIQHSLIKEGYSKKLALLIASTLSKNPDQRPSPREILQQLTHDNDGVADTDTAFVQNESLLRETLAAHPLFANVAKKQNPPPAAAAAAPAAAAAATHSSHNTRHADNGLGRPAAKTPPGSNTAHKETTKESTQRKRMTMAEGELQRLVQTDDDRASVAYLAGQFDRMGAGTSRDRKSPPPQSPQQPAWQTARSPLTANDRAATFPTSGSNSSGNTAATPTAGGGFAKGSNTKSPTSPLASPRPPHQTPGVASRERRATAAPVPASHWPQHPRSPIANDGSGGSAADVSDNWSPKGPHRQAPPPGIHSGKVYAPQQQQAQQQQQSPVPHTYADPRHAAAHQQQHPHHSPAANGAHATHQHHPHHHGYTGGAGGGIVGGAGGSGGAGGLHFQSPPQHRASPTGGGGRGIGETGLRQVHTQLQQIHQQQLSHR
eukprot:Rhum_TRINITY_DN14588_c32_g1::Rhum_TRINITY_DN14588_c32_g1_i1::g.96137::m.96137/K08857/NEK1_4_5; NIMA (never in mitosis gene a)-related kinase 1/4/5